MSYTIATPASFRNTFDQKSLVNTKRPQRSPVGYLFNPTPKGIHRELKSSGEAQLFTVLIELRAKGIHAPATGLLASEMNLGVRQTLRLARGLEDKGKVRRRRRYNASSVYELIGLRGEVSVINVTLKKQELTTSTLKTTTPREVSRSEVTITEPEPKTPPAPSPAQVAWEAARAKRREQDHRDHLRKKSEYEARGREWRRSRQAAKRQARHAKAKAAPRLAGRSKRHQKSTVTIYQAALHVMAVQGVSESLWQTRRAIEHSLVRWMETYGVPVERAVNALVAKWREYVCLPLEYPSGMMTWFGECRWLTGLTRAEESHMQLRANMAVGSHRRASCRIDLDKLRERMVNLGFDVSKLNTE